MEKNDDTSDREENTMGKALQGKNSVIYWTNRKKHHIKKKKERKGKAIDKTGRADLGQTKIYVFLD